MNGWRLSTSRLRERARRTIGCCRSGTHLVRGALSRSPPGSVGIALLIFVLELVGSVGYQLVGFSAQTIQTALTALAWYFILRAGFPSARIEYKGCLPHTPPAWR
jgi:hypothetical protein